MPSGGRMKGSAQLSAWVASGERRRLAGHDVFVRRQVAAGRPPLLLIHGFPTASYDWHGVWAPLAERYSLYTLDLLGFGMSAKPGGTRYSIPLQADICQAALAEQGVAVAHVLAHDYGDTVAQELLARIAEGRARFASVCFLNGGLFPETHRARPVQKLLATPVIGALVARAMRYEGFEQSMLAIAGRQPPSRGDLQDLWVLLERDGGRQALARLIGYMDERRRNRERWVGALVDARIPLKLICGAVDPVSGAHMAHRYRELVPDPDVSLLEDVGHYPQLEEPGRVLREYLGFRDRIGSQHGQ